MGIIGSKALNNKWLHHTYSNRIFRIKREKDNWGTIEETDSWLFLYLASMSALIWSCCGTTFPKGKNFEFVSFVKI